VDDRRQGWRPAAEVLRPVTGDLKEKRYTRLANFTARRRHAPVESHLDLTARWHNPARIGSIAEAREPLLSQTLAPACASRHCALEPVSLLYRDAATVLPRGPRRRRHAGLRLLSS